MKILLTIAHGIRATVEVIPDEEESLTNRLDVVESRLNRHYTMLADDQLELDALNESAAGALAEIKGGPFQNVQRR